jgi:hypothetical protein
LRLPDGNQTKPISRMPTTEIEKDTEKNKEVEVEQAALNHLSRIEGELETIKNRTPDSKRSFINGVWQGAGVVLGGIVAVLLLGWVLFIFGLIPGFGFITSHLKDAVAEWRGR